MGRTPDHASACMAASVAGHRRAFGGDVVPGNYEDLELADLVVLVGSNLAWCHPVLYRRLARARAERGTRVVVIDPRRTATCDAADLHLALKPGSDVALFNGLLAYLDRSGALDRDYIARHTGGFAEALAAAAGEPRAVAEACGLDAGEAAAYAKECATLQVDQYGQNPAKWQSPTDAANEEMACWADDEGTCP